MTEPLMKQIIDLKEEHELMLAALHFFTQPLPENITLKEVLAHLERARQVALTAIEAGEAGNERRANGNVDLPDRRGMKDGTT